MNMTLTNEQLEKMLEELYKEKHDLEEKLHICLGNIDTYEQLLEESCKYCGTRKRKGYLCMECGRI